MYSMRYSKDDPSATTPRSPINFATIEPQTMKRLPEMS